jgi:hypothetical protein
MFSVSPHVCEPRKWSEKYQESLVLASLSSHFSLNVLSLTNLQEISCNRNNHAVL